MSSGQRTATGANVEAAMVDYYAQRAQEYERIYEKPERQAELRELKQIVRETVAGRHMLDVACGTGYWTEVAAESAASITAFDINESVLAIARGKPVDLTKVTFLIGDAYQPPPFPRRFDAALVAFLWSHIPKARLGEFLRGLEAALSPGAVVLFLDNTHVPSESTSVTRRDAEGNTYQMRQLENGNTFEVLKNYPTEWELRDAVLSMAQDIEIHWLKHYWSLRFLTASGNEAPGKAWDHLH
jgi:demethylmenaquinone methyltransferase/2-methoxy-6-polyprenyl-1,4-benzoquinol methylase